MKSKTKTKTKQNAKAKAKFAKTHTVIFFRLDNATAAKFARAAKRAKMSSPQLARVLAEGAAQ